MPFPGIKIAVYADGANNVSPSSNAIPVTIDTLPPAAPIISTVGGKSGSKVVVTTVDEDQNIRLRALVAHSVNTLPWLKDVQLYLVGENGHFLFIKEGEQRDVAEVFGWASHIHPLWNDW